MTTTLTDLIALPEMKSQPARPLGGSTTGEQTQTHQIGPVTINAWSFDHYPEGHDPGDVDVLLHGVTGVIAETYAPNGVHVRLSVDDTAPDRPTAHLHGFLPTAAARALRDALNRLDLD